jgi:sugar lactone lactonase YvrE
MRIGHLVTLCTAGTLFATDDPLPPESRVTPVKVADLSAYSEGVVVDHDGSIFVSVRGPHAVLRLPPTGGQESWLPLTRPNGHKILPDGTHWIAGEGTLVHVAPSGQVVDSLVMRSGAQPLRQPNDIALDGHAGLYFTDPSVTEDDQRNRRGRVYHLDPQLRISLAADSLCYPNGVVVRSDGKSLYLDDSCDSRVYAYPILAAGQLGAREVFATLPDSGECSLDGMTLDASGRLYVAHYGCGRVEVLDTVGHLLRRYTAGNQLASNVAFGGPNLGDLYVTGTPGEKTGPGALYRLRLGIRGRSGRELPAR